MSYQVDDPRFIYMPLSDVAETEGPVHVVKNAYWAVHPERGLVFWQQTPKNGLRGAKPQCNKDKRIADQIVPQIYPWAEVRFIPIVLWPAE